MPLSIFLQKIDLPKNKLKVCKSIDGYNEFYEKRVVVTLRGQSAHKNRKNSSSRNTLYFLV